jgi:hypothetical protein
MIEFQTINISERCREIYEKQLISLKKEEGMSVMLSHFGYFSQDLVNGFSENIEEILISSGEKKGILKRIFSILIEGLQNIRVHGEKDNDGEHYGSCIVAKSSSNYKIIFGSLMKTELKNTIKNRIDTLNSLEEDRVKEHYMTVLSNGIVSATGNAGLGFITMRLKSKNLVQASFYEVAENLQAFIIELTIEIEKEN